MLSQPKLEILSAFFPKLEERTSKDIESLTGFSHETVFRLLKELVKEKYLEERKIGKTNIFRFIITDETYLIYTYFMTKKNNTFKKAHTLLFKRLKEFSNLINADSVILFGSYSKGTETSYSDVDVLVISNRKDIQKISLSFKTKYNIKINPVVVKPADFSNIKKDNPAFYNDLVEFGIIIDGIDPFFKEVYKSGKNI